jgi:hypothetical protein
VVIFGITGGETGKKECREIIATLTATAKKLGKLKLHVFWARNSGGGKRTASGPARFQRRSAVRGCLPAERVVDALREADLMLFVREPISTRRGSAIAGISCGLR